METKFRVTGHPLREISNGAFYVFYVKNLTVYKRQIWPCDYSCIFEALSIGKHTHIQNSPDYKFKHVPVLQERVTRRCGVSNIYDHLQSIKCLSILINAYLRISVQRQKANCKSGLRRVHIWYFYVLIAHDQFSRPAPSHHTTKVNWYTQPLPTSDRTRCRYAMLFK